MDQASQSFGAGGRAGLPLAPPWTDAGLASVEALPAAPGPGAAPAEVVMASTEAAVAPDVVSAPSDAVSAPAEAVGGVVVEPRPVAVSADGDLVAGEPAALGEEPAAGWRRIWRRLLGGPDRVVGLDIARGLAILGMFAAHAATVEPLDWSKPGSWAGIVNGRSSVLFAVLAGVSLAIMTGGRRPYTGQRAVDARIRILTRGVALLILGGILQAVSGNVALILEYYAIVFIVSLIFVRWPLRRLVIAIVVMIPAAPLGVMYGTALLQNMETLGFSGFGGSGFWTWAVTGTYPLLVWLPLCLMGVVIGRLNLRSVRTAAWVCLTGLVLAVLGYGASALFAQDWSEFGGGSSSSWKDPKTGSAVYGDKMLDGGSADGGKGSADWSIEEVPVPPADELTCGRMGTDDYVYCTNEPDPFGTDGGSKKGDDFDYYGGDAYWPEPGEIPDRLLASSPHSGGAMDIIGSGGFAIFVLGLCLLLARPLRFVLFPLAAVGSMALTAYVLHVLALTASSHYPSWFGFVSNGSGHISYAYLVISVVAFAVIWRAFLGTGPLERGLGALARRAQRAPDKPFAGGQKKRKP